MENKSIETGEGYFSNRIRNFLIEHHPDRMEREDFQKQVEAYAQQAVQLFLAYDQDGMATYEALERALVETLESIRSPYAILLDFLNEHRELLAYLTPGVEADSPEVLDSILRNHRPLVQALLDAPSSEEAKSAHQPLFQAILKTLSDCSHSSS